MATNNPGGTQAPSATQETIKDINAQVGDTVNAAMGAAKTGAKKVSNNPEQQPATTTSTTNPAQTEVKGNRSEAAQKSTEETESKIHKMNEKIKDFFRKLKPKKETTGASGTEASAGTTTEAAAQPGTAAK